MTTMHNRQRAHALLDQVADSDTERAEVRRVLSGIGHCSHGHEACPTPYTCDYDDADQLRAARGILGWLIAALALWALMASVVIWIGG